METNTKQWPVPITVSYSDGLPVVCAGKRRESRFVLFRGGNKRLYESNAHQFIDTSDVPSHRDMKARMRWYSDNLGSSFFRAWNGATWKVWIGDDFKLISKLCAGMGGYLVPSLVEKFKRNEQLVKQAIADGINNVSPIVMVFGKSPQELKESLGKGLWKRISRNAFSRNKAIACLIHKASHDRPAMIEKLTPLLQSIPSTVLTKVHRDMLSVTHLVCIKMLADYRAQDRSLTKVSAHDLMLCANIAEDVSRMARQLGEEVDPSWPYSTLLKKHEQYIKRVEMQRHSPTPWNTFGWPEKIEHEKDYELVLLNNALALREEGRVMHHCVGSYINSARSGQCIIYSVRHKGTRLSTLQFRAGESVGVGQHYGLCNAQVPPAHAKKLAPVIDSLIVQMTPAKAA